MVCKLPETLNGNSGLVAHDGGGFWIINDHESTNSLYKIDSNCRVLRHITVINAEHIDWEDLCMDDAGNLYIGDFGNNANQRKNLKIYKLHRTDMDLHDSVVAEIIHFNYHNQTTFPPSSPQLNFDMEAMVWFRGFLYLFSKNRTNPFTGYTYLYKLPDTSGNYSVSPLDSFYTGPGPFIQYWITGASIVANKLFLLSHDRAWLFEPFNEISLLNTSFVMFTFPHFTQKEAISFSNNESVWITDEFNSTLNSGGNLYHATLKDPTATKFDSPNVSSCIILNTNDYLIIASEEVCLFQIFDLFGICVASLDNLNGAIDISFLISGMYFLVCDQAVCGKFIKG
ncbi:MAG: hypothetical protein M3Q56_12830 [Bacteroidota bacterium]|nr:hypothetical protein [Bacteroidota bacterium]